MEIHSYLVSHQFQLKFCFFRVITDLCHYFKVKHFYDLVVAINNGNLFFLGTAGCPYFQITKKA